MIALERTVNMLSGAVPGGLVLLCCVLVLWSLLVWRILPGTGVLGERGPAGLGFSGMLLAIVLFGLARQKLTPPQGEPRWALWPPEGLPAGLGEGLSAIEEAHLLAHGQPLATLRHGLEGPRNSALAQADSIMAALQVEHMVLGGMRGDSLYLEYWERRWGVGRRELHEAWFLGAEPDSEAMAGLQSTYHRFCTKALGVELPAPGRHLLPESLPLFAVVSDSARHFLDLATPFRQWEDELRAADQLLAIDRRAEAGRIVAALNRGLDTPEGPGADVYLLAATWFAWQGQWDKVIQSLDNCLALEPGHPRAWWIIAHLDNNGLSHFGMTGAEQAREKALDLNPGYRPALFAQVRWLADHRRLDPAHARVQAALVLYRNDPELHILAGNTDRTRMSYGTCEAHYHRAAALLPPDDHRPWWNLGQLYYMQGRDSLAIENFEQAVRLGCPPEALHLLGMSHLQVGDTTIAREYFLRRLKLGGKPGDMERARRQLERLPALADPVTPANPAGP